jgi:hypothetical protein
MPVGPTDGGHGQSSGIVRGDGRIALEGGWAQFEVFMADDIENLTQKYLKCFQGMRDSVDG